ncbi:MAG: hypothetical protein ACE5EF_05570 [Dehalococcoidia bacterium]
MVSDFATLLFQFALVAAVVCLLGIALRELAEEGVAVGNPARTGRSGAATSNGTRKVGGRARSQRLGAGTVRTAKRVSARPSRQFGVVR